MVQQIHISAAPLPIQFPAHVPEKEFQKGPTAQAPSTLVSNWDGASYLRLYFLPSPGCCSYLQSEPANIRCKILSLSLPHALQTKKGDFFLNKFVYMGSSRNSWKVLAMKKLCIDFKISWHPRVLHQNTFEFYNFVVYPQPTSPYPCVKERSSEVQQDSVYRLVHRNWNKKKWFACNPWTRFIEG